MELTLRYYSDKAIKKVISAIERICNSVALAAGIPDTKLPLIEVDPSNTPPVLNNSELSEKIHGFASDIIGSENISKVMPEMVGEDFGI